jgi:KUP system potassium uptake protein
MHHETSRRDSNIFLLAVGSLGVVFGDIGTSPMYAIQESMLTPGLPAAAESVLGYRFLYFLVAVGHCLA